MSDEPKDFFDHVTDFSNTVVDNVGDAVGIVADAGVYAYDTTSQATSIVGVTLPGADDARRQAYEQTAGETLSSLGGLAVDGVAGTGQYLYDTTGGITEDLLGMSLPGADPQRAKDLEGAAGQLMGEAGEYIAENPGKALGHLATGILGDKGLSKLAKLAKLKNLSKLGKLSPDEAKKAIDKIEDLTDEQRAMAKADIDAAAGKDGVLVKKTPPSKALLKYVTPAELKLASEAGTSAKHIAARKKVAEAFYKEYSNVPAHKIQSHLDGIDFKKPVHTRLSPPPDLTEQFVVPGNRPGQYHTNHGSKPTEVGVGDFGVDPSTGKTVQRIPTNQTVNPGSPVLESTADGIVDNFSGKKGTIFENQKTEGGGTQYFIPHGD